MRAFTRWAVLAIVLGLPQASGAAVTEADLQSYAGRSRVLLVFAPQEAGAELARQRATLAAAQPALRERDVAVLEIVGDSPADQRFRGRYRAGSGFLAVLIGKDGGAKLVSAEPIMAAHLAEVIDAMPMRRSEAARKRP